MSAASLSTTLSPAFTLGSLAGSLSAPDLDEAAAHFSPDACLITAAGQQLRGEAIAISLAELIEERPLVCIEGVEVAEAGDLAAAAMRWSGHCVTESPAKRIWEARAGAVLRRSAAQWTIAILAPWGDPKHRLPVSQPAQSACNGAAA